VQRQEPPFEVTFSQQHTASITVVDTIPCRDGFLMRIGHPILASRKVLSPTNLEVWTPNPVIYIYTVYGLIIKKTHLIDLHNSWSLKGNPFHRRRKENYKFIGATETQQHPCLFRWFAMTHDPIINHDPLAGELPKRSPNFAKSKFINGQIHHLLLKPSIYSWRFVFIYSRLKHQSLQSLHLYIPGEILQIFSQSLTAEVIHRGDQRLVRDRDGRGWPDPAVQVATSSKENMYHMAVVHRYVCIHMQRKDMFMIRMYLYVSICFFLHLYVSLSIYLCMYVCVYVCMCVCAVFYFWI